MYSETFKWLTVGLCLVFLGGVGIWNFSELKIDIEEATSSASRKIQSVPKELGPWRAEESPMDRKVMEVAEALTYSNRNYQHADGTKTTSVLLMFGNTGAQAAHNPAVCYQGFGFQQVDEPQVYRLPEARVDSQSIALWTARFTRTEPTPQTLRLFWGWGDAGGWEAPENPRFQLAGRKMIYKIYIQRVVQKGHDSAEEFDEFLITYFLELQKSLRS